MNKYTHSSMKWCLAVGATICFDTWKKKKKQTPVFIICISSFDYFGCLQIWNDSTCICCFLSVSAQIVNASLLTYLNSMITLVCGPYALFFLSPQTQKRKKVTHWTDSTLEIFGLFSAALVCQLPDVTLNLNCLTLTCGHEGRQMLAPLLRRVTDALVNIPHVTDTAPVRVKLPQVESDFIWVMVLITWLRKKTPFIFSACETCTLSSHRCSRHWPLSSNSHVEQLRW